jgi:S1-C subfamily serine protease
MLIGDEGLAMHGLRARAAPLLRRLTFVCIAAMIAASAAPARAASLGELVSAVVRVKASIEPDGRTLDTLGREREGSGIVIDDKGLVLTIGYLIVEARTAEIGTNDGRTIPATVVGYDHETGFGLVRALLPLKVSPMPFGTAAAVKEGEPALVASFGGPDMVGPARIAAKRAFAGGWEYLLDEALFTTPPHSAWSGAALISRDGKLVGVGSLLVPDAGRAGEKEPGNMFVPIDLLPPILADLVANGRKAGAGRPWLGLSAAEVNGELRVTRVTPGSPADRAGIRARGTTIVGVNGVRPTSLADFYRKVWALGAAGTAVPLDLMQDDEARRVEVKSTNRLDHLKLNSSL